MLREDERATANQLAAALTDGRVAALGGYRATWTEGADPPDLLVALGGEQTVSVELGRVLDDDYTQQMAAARRGKLRAGMWQPRPAEEIRRVFENKSAIYRRRGIKVDWLVFHDSLIEVPGFYDLGPLGHRELREDLEGLFASGPFRKVLLQSEWQRKVFWSVLWDQDGRMIETPHAYAQRVWRDHFCDDAGVLHQKIRVHHVGRSIFPPEGHGVVVLIEGGEHLHDLAAAGGQPRRAAHALTREVAPRHWGWIPTSTPADEQRVAEDLYKEFLHSKPPGWHEVREND